MFKRIIISTCLTGLTACASIIEGSTQQITINTTPGMAASCTVENERGNWGQTSTPSTVNVKRSKSDLVVMCASPTHEGQFIKKSSLEPWTLGNILLGGIIGACVDAGTGAMFTYDDTINVAMTEKSSSTNMDTPNMPMTSQENFNTDSTSPVYQAPASKPPITRSMMLPPPQF